MRGWLKNWKASLIRVRGGVLFFSFFLIFSSSCIRKPSAPSWDSEVNLPLVDSTFYMADLLSDIDYVRADSTNTIPEMYFTTALDTITIGESFTVEASETTQTFALGTIAMDISGSGQAKVLLKEIWPADFPPLSEDKKNATVPEIPTTQLQKNKTIAKIEWAQVKKAFYISTIINNLSIPIYPLTVETYNDLGESIVTNNFSDPILPGEIVVDTQIVENIYITKDEAITVTIGSPGSNGEEVAIAANDSLVVMSNFTDAEIDSAYGEIPALSKDYVFTIPLPSEFSEIDSLGFKGGSLDLNFNNQTSLQSNWNLTIPEASYETTFAVPPLTYKQVAIPLSDRVFYLYGTSEIQSAIKVDLISAYTTVRKTDEFTVNSNLNNPQIEFIAGFLSEPIKIALPEQDTSFELEKAISGFRFGEVDLLLDLINTSESSPTLELNLGINDASEFYTIPVEAGGETRTTLDITDLMNNALGSNDSITLQLSGNAVLQGEVIVFADDYVTGSGELTAPFKLVLTGDTVFSDTSKDTTTLDEETFADVEEGKLFLNLVSHLPLGVGMKLMVTHPLSKNEDLILTRTVDIPVAPYDAKEDEVIRDTSVTIELELEQEEIEIFTKEPRYTWVEFFLPSTNGDTVTVHLADYVKVLGYATLKMRIGE